jgi:hypothetical protein
LRDYPPTEKSVREFIEVGVDEAGPFRYEAQFEPVSEQVFAGDDPQKKVLYEMFLKKQSEEGIGGKSVGEFVMSDRGNGAAVRLSEQLPEGYRVYNNPDLEGELAVMDLPGQVLIVGGDMRKVANVLTLYHQVGHVRPYAAASPEEKKAIEAANKAHTNGAMSVRLDEQSVAESEVDIPSDELAAARVRSWEQKALEYSSHVLAPVLGQPDVSELAVQRVVGEVNDGKLETLSDDINSIPQLRNAA